MSNRKRPRPRGSAGSSGSPASSGSLRGSSPGRGGSNQARRDTQASGQEDASEQSTQGYRRAGPKGRPGPAGDAGRTVDRRRGRAQRPPSGRGQPSRRQPERDDPDDAPVVVQPPATVSFARGMIAVGSSPALLVTAFLSILALWLAFTAVSTGLVTSAAGIVQFLTLPPGHTFVDLGLLTSSRVQPLVGLAFGLALLAFRAILAGFLIAGSDIALRGRTRPADMARSAFGQAARAFWVVLALEAGYLVATLLALTLPFILGAQAESLVYSVWLVGSMYFFAYTEVIAVIERARPAACVRWAMQAARLPGRDHALLVFSYALLSLLLPTFAARIAGIQATPSISAWIYALVVSFLNVSLLAALTWRWNIIGQAVKAGAGVRPRRSRTAYQGGRR